MRPDLIERILDARHDIHIEAEKAWCEIESRLYDRFELSDITRSEMEHIMVKAYANWTDHIETIVADISEELLRQSEINRMFEVCEYIDKSQKES